MSRQSRAETAAAIERALAENTLLIASILSHHNRGRHASAAALLARLQQNLAYIASVADPTPHSRSSNRQIHRHRPWQPPASENLPFVDRNTIRPNIIELNNPPDELATPSYTQPLLGTQMPPLRPPIPRPPAPSPPPPPPAAVAPPPPSLSPQHFAAAAPEPFLLQRMQPPWHPIAPITLPTMHPQATSSPFVSHDTNHLLSTWPHGQMLPHGPLEPPLTQGRRSQAPSSHAEASHSYGKHSIGDMPAHHARPLQTSAVYRENQSNDFVESGGAKPRQQSAHSAPATSCGSADSRRLIQSSRHWTEEERTLFEESINIHGNIGPGGKPDLQAISRYIGTRTPLQVRSYYQKWLKRRTGGQPSMSGTPTLSTGLSLTTTPVVTENLDPGGDVGAQLEASAPHTYFDTLAPGGAGGTTKEEGN